jgi:hypothetical protein
MSKIKWIFQPSPNDELVDDTWTLSGTVYHVQVAGAREYVVMEFHEAEGWGRDHGVFKTLKKAMTRAEVLAGRTRWDVSMNGRPQIGSRSLQELRRMAAAVPPWSKLYRWRYEPVDQTPALALLGNILPEDWKFLQDFSRGSPPILRFRDGTGHILMTRFFEEDYRLTSILQIEAHPPGSGMGTVFMEAMRQYADLRGRKFCVGLVANIRFFRKFKWLVPDDGDETSIDWCYTPKI